MLVSKEKAKKERKKHTNDPNDASRIIWARFSQGGTDTEKRAPGSIFFFHQLSLD